MTGAALVAYLIAVIFLSIVMTAAWWTVRRTGNGGWTDAFWSFGLGAAGLALALVPVSGTDWPTLRQVVVAALVAAWGLRLGLHIAARAARGAEDPRYAELRREWGDDFSTRLFRFLHIQAAAGAFLALSILLAAQNAAPGLPVSDWVAVAILVTAVLGESIADRQLQAFKADPANHGKICDTGLWSRSRHPNYFFEWLGWLAYPLFAIDLGGDHPWGWLALTGPAFMYWLLVRVSGIPPLEAHMIRSRGDAFRAYAQRVPPFFPTGPKG